LGPGEFNKYLEEAFRPFKQLMLSDKPTIAAIHGYAVGAGMELALSCDFVIVAEDGQMGSLFVRVGIAPDLGLYLLPRLVGLGRAKAMTMLSETITAQDAKQMGLL